MREQALLSEQETRVRHMFADIAPTYDLNNSLLSLNVHKRWRPLALDAAQVGPGSRVLDLATGTADVALLAAERVGPNGCVIGVDLCEPMLRHGQAKARQHGRPGSQRLRLAVGTAEGLPFADDTFDAALMAFGLRNVPDAGRCLGELARVVRSGGWVVNLELTRPTQPLAARLYRFYQNTVMPFVGGLVSGKREAYEYLPRTIQRFADPDQVADLFRRAGMTEVSWQPLTFGIATLHRGRKP